MAFQKHRRDVLYDADSVPNKVAVHAPAREEGGDLVFPAAAVNDYLGCSICQCYLRNAHTITECLHTFCRKCILRYFREGKKIVCPKCKLEYPGDCENPPDDILRYDRSVQMLVDKIFPELKETEGDIPDMPVNIEKRNLSALYKPSQEILKVEVMLRPLPDSKLPKLEKSWIRCGAGVTTYTLAKYCKFKLGIDSDLELMMKDRVVGAEHSLEYLLRTSTENALELMYRPATFPRN